MRKRKRQRRHQECLRRIDRLERSLFPEWFPRHEKVDWMFEPGAMWIVEDHNDVQRLNQNALLVSASAYKRNIEQRLFFGASTG